MLPGEQRNDPCCSRINDAVSSNSVTTTLVSRMGGVGRLQDDVIARWADLLVDYCLKVERGETIALGAEVLGRPLVEACYKAIVKRGGHPLVRLDLPGLHEFFIQEASDAQLSYVPPLALFEAQAVSARIRIAADSDTRSMSWVDPGRQATFERARDPIRQASRRARWVLTQFPTPAYAADARMTLPEYEAFVTRALFLDRPDPRAAWQELGRRQAGLVEFMLGVRQVRIEADETDLTLSVAGRTWINSDGKRNMPSGEIFTGPVEDSATGRLRCGFPVCRNGRELVGISLEFREGRVIRSAAADGADYLLAMLDLDPGARRLGEFGLGLNSGIDRFTGSILYDEKIGGTVHLALGQSYPETGGINNSALHWDLIVDTRSNGRITADGRLVMENGHWLVG
jgi:aminopeptidase